MIESLNDFLQLMLVIAILCLFGIDYVQNYEIKQLQQQIKPQTIICADDPGLAVGCTLLPNGNVSVEYGDKWKKKIK